MNFETENSISIESNNEWNLPFVPFILVLTSFVLYGKYPSLNYAIAGFFVITCFYFEKQNALPLLCIPLYFFDYVLVLPFGGGATFNRIYEFIFILFYLIKSRGKLQFSYNKLPVVFIYIVMSFWASLSLTSVISATLNVLTLVIVFEQLDSYRNRNILLFTIGMAGVFTGIYALVNGSQMVYEYGTRLSSGIGDPNFTSLLYIVAFFGVVCTDIINKYIKGILVIFLGVVLLLTISQTGIFGGIILVLLFAYTIKPSKGILFSIIGCALAFVFYNMDFEATSIFYGIHQRLINSLGAASIGDYSSVTTGRSKLWGEYLNILWNNYDRCLLFGGTDPTTKEFRNLWGMRVAAHNSYVDALYMVGIPGLIFIITCFSKRIIEQIRMYKESSDFSILGLVFIKITIVFFGFVLSFFASKIFSVGFLL